MHAGRTLRRVNRVEDHVDAFVPRVAFVLHAEFLHDPARSAVRGLGYGYDSVEAHAFEAIGQDGTGGFGCQAAAPVRAGQPPAYFDIRGAGERLESAEADHLIGLRFKESPHAEPALANAGHLACDEFLDAIIGPGQSLADVPHNLGVGRDRLEGLPIGFRPWGEEEALGAHRELPAN